MMFLNWLWPAIGGFSKNGRGVGRAKRWARWNKAADQPQAGRFGAGASRSPIPHQTIMPWPVRRPVSRRLHNVASRKPGSARPATGSLEQFFPVHADDQDRGRRSCRRRSGRPYVRRGICASAVRFMRIADDQRHARRVANACFSLVASRMDVRSPHRRPRPADRRRSRVRPQRTDRPEHP